MAINPHSEKQSVNKRGFTVGELLISICILIFLGIIWTGLNNKEGKKVSFIHIDNSSSLISN